MNNFLSFLFVTFLSAFIYACYLYCLQNEYLNSYGRTVRIILGALSAPLFVCYYWSFLKCSLNNPGYVDTTWEANAEENNIQIEKRKIRNYTPNKYTICDKCDFLVRPERAHHCRSCKRCVLKMDHHCPWIGTCVGERNLKFFFLFLSYGLLTTVYIAVTISPKFVLALHESESNKASETLHHGALLISKRKRKNDPPTVCASLTMMIALVFMNCQYVYFISRNITIIESSYTDKVSIGKAVDSTLEPL
ncbi:hypothetical protein PVMG_04947 [Plasmodium vivax Mauritania I]|uniref:Palmitoyltransferase n=1 Tax=Plasmodium vivax Mauritania I TaxID=1035515 RepID=A0A0J9TDQ3_PLAVI|nr:hypothetical protein PVMG_04947 [Plasmodium vivax Mauritania I]